MHGSCLHQGTHASTRTALSCMPPTLCGGARPMVRVGRKGGWPAATGMPLTPWAAVTVAAGHMHAQAAQWHPCVRAQGGRLQCTGHALMSAVCDGTQCSMRHAPPRPSTPRRSPRCRPSCGRTLRSRSSWRGPPFSPRRAAGRRRSPSSGRSCRSSTSARTQPSTPPVSEPLAAGTAVSETLGAGAAVTTSV